MGYIQWAARVRQLAADCKFGAALDEMLRDRFIIGMSAGPERDKLFMEDTFSLTLTKSLEIAVAINSSREAARQSTSSQSSGNVEIFRLTSGHKGQKCIVCGYNNHDAKQCRFSNYKCKKCGEKGHLKKMCKKFQNHVNNIQTSEECNNVSDDVLKTNGWLVFDSTAGVASLGGHTRASIAQRLLNCFCRRSTLSAILLLQMRCCSLKGDWNLVTNAGTQIKVVMATYFRQGFLANLVAKAKSSAIEWWADGPEGALEMGAGERVAEGRPAITGARVLSGGNASVVGRPVQGDFVASPLCIRCTSCTGRAWDLRSSRM
ncbi:hypothetical protein K1T71_015290 [Dendrolimus kikuchii]|nr:hypothetical protein K1T71_015290 [Dendrolimus kikuchii]